jgi:hypothetical protein
VKADGHRLGSCLPLTPDNGIPNRNILGAGGVIRPTQATTPRPNLVLWGGWMLRNKAAMATQVTSYRMPCGDMAVIEHRAAFFGGNMKIIKFAGSMLLAAAAIPAAAQSIPDDVRCLALSNAFAKNATEEPARQAASRALLFYLGRLDARGDPQAIRSAMQSSKIDPKTAPTDMSACSTRFANAAQTMESLVKAAPPGK